MVVCIVCINFRSEVGEYIAKCPGTDQGSLAALVMLVHELLSKRHSNINAKINADNRECSYQPGFVSTYNTCLQSERVLYTTQTPGAPLFVNGLNPELVIQHELYDCYFVLHERIGPYLIYNIKR